MLALLRGFEGLDNGQRWTERQCKGFYEKIRNAVAWEWA